jgi:predicted enzyme related to lactoylglutathione lyase
MDLAAHSGRNIAPFYSAVCGWDAAESSEEFGGYFMFMNNGQPAAGAMPAPPEQPGGWTMYVQVDDVAAALDKVTSAGGMVIAGPIPIADLGTMAVIADPSGCPFGLWSPDTFTGFALDGQVGSPIWFELYAKDYAGSQQFLSDVFGWTFDVVSDTDQFRYAMVSFDGEPKLGIMDFSADMHASMPAYWNNYIRVANCDEAAAAVETNGGELLMSPMDSPHGRMAAVRDPDGAVFSLMQSL